MDGFCASVQSYRTMKFHVIEDPKLALCFRGIQLLVVLRAISELYLQSGYLAKYQPTGQANVYAQHTREANFSVAAVPPPYCCQNFSCAHPALGQAYACYNGHSMAHNGCRQYKFGEVVHKKKNAIFVVTWAPEFGGRNGFPPPENHELVLSIEMGCADTVPFQSKLNTPF